MHKFTLLPIVASFCILLPSLHGRESLVKGIHEYEAGSFDRAGETFRALLNQPNLSEEERAVLLYNLGTSLASEKNYETARTVFQEVVPQQIVSKEVRRSFFMNYTLLLLQIGSSQDIQEAKALAKEVSPQFEAQVEEEAFFIELQKKQEKNPPVQVEEVIIPLFLYIQKGGKDPLFFQQIRALFKEASPSNKNLVESLIELDPRACIRYELDQYIQEIEPLFKITWKRVEKNVPTIAKKKVEECVPFLQGTEATLVAKTIEYWVFYDGDITEESLHFAIDFEKRAAKVGKEGKEGKEGMNEASLARKVTIDVLKKMSEVKLDLSLHNEVQEVLAMAEKRDRFEMQSSLHMKVQALLEKIEKMIQKQNHENKDQESSSQEAPKSDTSAKISAPDAIRLSEEMEMRDRNPSSASTQSAGGKYPW